jgi:2',3'-cyclic-nucleotide 2'-phosphodiesterase (5'-nucleotidase family)
LIFKLDSQALVLTIYIPLGIALYKTKEDLMKIIKIFLFILSINFILSGQDVTHDKKVTSQKTKSTNLTIFFTNDTNGHPLNFSYFEQDGLGGIPARAALIKKLTLDKKSDFLILDTGGYTLGLKESNLYNGLTDVTGMNSTGYYAAGIGTSEISDSLKSLEYLNSKADFYFLCANLFKNTSKKDPICDKYVIKKIGGMGGINVGIFSVISDDE